jgi:ribose 5-phosphate isomerase A
MTQDEMKKVAAAAAIELLPDGGVVGVGTGSTVNHFIDLLAKVKHRVDGAVSSSETSTAAATSRSTWTARTSRTATSS